MAGGRLVLLRGGDRANPNDLGTFLVQLNVRSNPSGCKNKQWFYRDYGGEGAEYMFRTLLMALDSGQKVRLYVTGSCDLNGYSDISSAGIIP